VKIILLDTNSGMCLRESCQRKRSETRA